MPYCWYLTSTDLTYMPDKVSGKIVHVQVSKTGDVKTAKEFTLPAGAVIKNPIPYNMDAFVESHSCEDKQALRDLISANANVEELPETMLICSMRNKIFILTENSAVSWFKPDDHDDEAVTLEGDDFYTVEGWRGGHEVQGIFCSQQSMERHEFWTVSWNSENNHLGMEVYWTEGDPDRMDIRIGSEGWNHHYPHRIVKMLYMRQKHPEEGGNYPDRTIWKDKSLILLDAAGKIWKTRRGYSLNERSEEQCENCIDIQIDS